jgi:Mg2+/Co2+ transporter CorB
LTLLRFRTPAEGQSHQLSIEEIRMLVLESTHFVQKKHQSILVNLFDLETITVDDVMTPRNQIEAIDINDTPDDIRHQVATCYHTRLPVFRERLEDIIGIVHIRKMLHLLQDKAITAENLQQLMKEAYFIPSGTPLLSQLQHFQEKQERIGIVVDEYGELMGLVTLDDILEEIIGEFTSHAPHLGGFVKQADGSILVEGSVLLRDLNRKLGLKFPIEGPKTLNGLILEHFQDIPEPGTSIKIAGHPLEIVQTHDRIVKAVRIFPAVQSA